MEIYVTDKEFGAYKEAAEKEDDRQNHRLSELEETVKKIQDLTVAVHEMSISISTMTKELTKQGERLEKIESKPAQSWDKLVWIIISAVSSGLIGYLIGFLLK
jgi:uncharacterized protein YoxC